MSEYERKTQTAEESLNWISFNLKALVKEVKELNVVIRELGSTALSIARVREISSKREDLPF